MPDEVSRHNAPSNALAIFKELKNFSKPEGVKVCLFSYICINELLKVADAIFAANFLQNISVTLLADWVDVCASVAAISRCFPLYDSRTNIQSPLEAVELEIIVSENDKVSFSCKCNATVFGICW